ncbi:hypothetical protein DL96DRAFT_1474600, partial [Flagelloscypha sp. PMI_526]
VWELVMLLVAFITLRGCLGRDNANALLRGLAFIFDLAIAILSIPFQTAGFQIQLPQSSIYKDIRTIYQHRELDAKLIATPCCPKCFRMNPRGTIGRSNQCPFKRSPHSAACGTNLIKWKRAARGMSATIPSSKPIPTAYYISQSFEAWICWMLVCPHIEDNLIKTTERTRRATGPLSRMNDVQDSPAWFEQKPWLTKGGYRLIFSIFIDWFNPYTNKIAGKVLSCGVIVLHCLNLPYHIRLRLENIFVAGMMPPPNSPDVHTISHILEVLVADLSSFCGKSRLIPSAHFPEGVEVEIQVWPFVSDLQAACKCGGHEASRAWKAEKSLKKKDELEKLNGVRWTPLHDLPNWDPVRHIKIGWMHNWLEGVLQHHLRVYWGIGRPKAVSKRLELMDQDELMSENDRIESDSELGALLDEKMDYQDENNSDTHTGNSSNDSDNSDASTIRWSLYFAAGDDDDDDDDDDFFDNPQGDKAFEFRTEQLGAIRQGLEQVQIPSYVNRPPSNLGEAKHGKLKAELDLTLVASVLPLVMSPYWWDERASGQLDTEQLAFSYLMEENFNDLSAYSTTNNEADECLRHLISYRSSSHKLFPFVEDRPNHHIAMHVPEEMKFWGPTPGLAENSGEQLNGQFGRIPTSRRPRK